MMAKNSKATQDNERAAFDEGNLDVASMRRVRVGRGEPKSSLAVRFDAADLEHLRRRAEVEGVGVTQLVRQWVLERLDEPDATGAVDELLEGLDKSIRAARAIRRSHPPRTS